MKKIIVILLISMVALNINAQLANTKWKGTLNVQGGVDVIFNFGTDSLEVISADDNSSLETLNYTIQDSVIAFQKLYGQSQCDNNTIGKYKFALNNDELAFTLIEDACDDRSSAVSNMKMNKSQ